MTRTEPIAPESYSTFWNEVPIDFDSTVPDSEFPEVDAIEPKPGADLEPTDAE